MSILWIDSSLILEKSTERIIFSDISIFLICNFLSIISFALLSYFYKTNTDFQKAPTNLTILKLVSEGFLSISLFLIILLIYFEFNNIRFLIEIISSFSPTIVFLCYYFNACTAHNLYLTYYDYKGGYNKRVLYYKVYSIIIASFIYILTLLSLDIKNLSNPFESNNFSFMVYKKSFVGLFYLVCFCISIYILRNMYYIILSNSEILTFEKDDIKDTVMLMLINSLIKRHISLLSFFLFAFIPNNIFMLLWSTNIINLENSRFSWFFSYFIILISLCPTFFIIVKLTDPYIQKYFKNIYFFFCMKKKSTLKLGDLGNEMLLHIKANKKEDKFHYSNIYTDNSVFELARLDAKNEEIKQLNNENNISFNDESRFSYDSEEGTRRYKSTNNMYSDQPKRLYSLFVLKEGNQLFDIVNAQLKLSDNLYRMIGISIALNEDREYDKDIFYLSKFASSLPWESKYYKEKSKLVEYTQENLPDWVNIKYDNRFKSMKIKIRKYVPLVFHHIRIIDKKTIDDCLQSLDPILNLEKKNSLNLNGGNSSNPILSTWDGKLLIKTISREEKRKFVEMIKEYQTRMRDTKTLLCRVYGLYRIKVQEKFDTFILIMRNMTELPNDSKYLKFDLKGSTVNRSCILQVDKNIYLQGHKEDVINRYKSILLKDNDFNFLNLKFYLSSLDSKNLMLSIENDADFLEKYYLTDYSLLCSIHLFRKEDYKLFFTNTRIMKSADDKYIFSFAIIDFLTTYNIEKIGEKIGKDIAHYVKMGNDNNFSVQDPNKYCDRFKNYFKRLIKNADV